MTMVGEAMCANDDKRYPTAHGLQSPPVDGLESYSKTTSKKAALLGNDYLEI